MEWPLPRWRHELKFWIDQDQARRIRRAASPFVAPDPHACLREPGVYTVRSIYYDSPRLDFYHHKLDGVRSRKKLRVRSYAGHGLVPGLFFEIKHKRGRKVLKERVRLGPEQGVDTMVALTVPSDHALPASAERAVQRFMMHVRQLALTPTILICYERMAFVDRANHDVRLTIDRDVRSLLRPTPNQLFEEAGVHPCTNGHAILELKFSDHMPRWMRGLVSDEGLRAASISKYCMSLESWMQSRTILAVPQGDDRCSTT